MKFRYKWIIMCLAGTLEGIFANIGGNLLGIDVSHSKYGFMGGFFYNAMWLIAGGINIIIPTVLFRKKD